jgi:hypothetical protein
MKAGATRFVFLIGPWAVKVPRLSCWRLFLHGLLANLQERAFSRTGWFEICPVLWALPGGFLLVMRRAEPLTDAQWARFDYGDFVNDPEGHVPAECKQSSFGLLDGRIVAVDYGS